MEANKINALSTAVIAFVTIIGLMFGFYYNLKAAGTKSLYIAFFELLIIIAIWLFVSWIRGGIKNE